MIIDEQGVNENRYKLIPRTLIFLTRRDNLLLLRGSVNKRLWADRYNGIGGHVERGENILDAARREIYEEAGLIPDDLWLCGIVTVDTGIDPGIGIFIFRGECSAGDLAKSPEGDLAWIKNTDYADLTLVEDLNQLLPVIMAMRKSQIPFFAHTSYDAKGKMVVKFVS